MTRVAKKMTIDAHNECFARTAVARLLVELPAVGRHLGGAEPWP